MTAQTLIPGQKLARQTHPNHPGETAYVVLTSGPKRTKVERVVQFRGLPNVPIEMNTQDILRDFTGESPYTNPCRPMRDDEVLDSDGYVA